jgi:phenylacetate-CoA ligase
MSVEFRIKDFFHPLSILKLRRFLEKSQWFSDERLQEYQLSRLQRILDHAYTNVPYYRALFNREGIFPREFTCLEDLQKIPPLTKELVKKNKHFLVARNAERFSPISCRTSGSTGEPVEFYLDRPSNVLEFCYYWRHWSWAGYRLGSLFSELASHHFLTHPKRKNDIYSFYRPGRRLLLNSILLSYDRIGHYVVALRKYRPRFLKGLASTLYVFALLVKEKGIDDLEFEAVFSTGEMLLNQHRKTIEEVLHCKVYDSYGHMERTVAISECPCGGYHLNSDYGILEVQKETGGNMPGGGTVLGTGLYNFSMPLIRYEVGDMVEADHENSCCKCGRGLPLIKKIHGRKEDVIVTPDERIITSAFTLFELVNDIELGQIVQEKKDRIVLRIVPAAGYGPESERQLIDGLRNFVGQDICIKIDYTSKEKIKPGDGRKFKTVVSFL